MIIFFFNCRYDTFIFIYSFILAFKFADRLDELNEDIKILHKISKDIMKQKNNYLNKGIWSVIEKYKDNYEFLKKLI